MTTMRIAVLSDIHGNLPALEAVVADIRRRGTDRVMNLGDSVSGPLLPRETAEFLIAQDWQHVAGNHERQLLSNADLGESDAYARAQLHAPHLRWLAGLPTLLRSDEGVLICHGTPTCDHTALLETIEPAGMRMAREHEVESRLAGTAADLLLCGHTHVARALRRRCGQLIVNPGSVGLPAYVDDRPWPHRVENGSPDARYALVERYRGQWQASLIAVPYDTRAVVRMAQERGRPEWARALASGWL